jgi:O-antigen ligase
MTSLAWADVPTDPFAKTPRLTALTMALFALTLPLGFAWGLGFPGFVSLAGLFCFPLLRPARPNSLLWLLLAIVAWAGLSMIWSRAAVDPHSLHRFADYAKLTGLKLPLQLVFYGAFVVAALRLNPVGAWHALMVLAVAVVLLSILILLDALLGAHAYMWLSANLDRPIRHDLARRNLSIGLYVVVVLFWCAAMRLWRARRRWPVVLMAICVIAASRILSEADATLAAFSLGLIAFVLVRLWGRIAVRVLAGVTAFYWLAAPFVIIAAERGGLIPAIRPFVQASWERRLDIWIFSAVRVTEKPLFGWGLDASRTFGGAISLHTHDAAMQVWLELGLVGALLFAALGTLVWRVVERVEQQDRTSAAALAGTIAAYLTIGGLSFGIWQEWWLAIVAIAVVAGACLVRGEGSAISRPFANPWRFLRGRASSHP